MVCLGFEPGVTGWMAQVLFNLIWSLSLSLSLSILNRPRVNHLSRVWFVPPIFTFLSFIFPLCMHSAYFFVQHSLLRTESFFKKMGQPRPLFHFFQSFQSNNTILSTHQCGKMSCPYSISYRESNPRPLEH